MRAVIIIILGIILLAHPWNMKSDGLEHISGEREGQMKESDAGTMGEKMSGYDFDSFPNVTISGIDISSLNEDELAVLHAQAEYCQAMTDADTDAMRNLVSEDMVYTHMSGMKQSREEYFADVESGRLRYYTIGIEDPVISVDGDKGMITYTSVLNADAYGAIGTYRIKGTHHYDLRDGRWILVSR